jgi:hypothetical protein
MVPKFLSYLFSCQHEHVTWPIKPRGSYTRQSCLDCGRSRRVRMTDAGWAFGRWSSEQFNQTVKQVLAERIA